MRDKTYHYLPHCLGVLLVIAVGLARGDEDHQFSRVGPEFLLSLKLSEQQNAEAKTLLEDLGSDKFLVRQKAERALYGTPVISMEHLEAAEYSGNAERQVTVRRLRDHMLLQLEEPLTRAYGEIRKERMLGWVGDVLYSMRFCQNNETYYAAEHCLLATTEATDRPALAKALTSPWHYERILAAATLLKDKTSSSLDLCAPLLTNSTSETKLYLANLYLEANDARGLIPLVDLLDDKHPEQRLVASAILKRVAADSEVVARTPEQWRTWIQTNGAAALKKTQNSRARLIHEPGLVADFDFKNEPHNAINQKPPTTRNVRTETGFLFLNGNFGAQDAQDDSFHFSYEVDQKSTAGDLCIQLEFKLAEQADAEDMTLIAIEADGRRISINLRKAGKITYTFQSTGRSTSISLGQEIHLDKWNKITLSCDEKRNSLNTKLNDQVTRTMGTQRIAFDDLAAGDTLSLSFDPQSGKAFHGYVAQLRLFNRALSKDEINAQHETGKFGNQR